MPMHQSLPLPRVEFVEIAPMDISPLISRCQIKVCYVGEDPNRNGSIITKEVAKEMAPSLRGAAIVGYFNDATQDFEGHNRVIDISGGEFKIKDTTKPYGFVDLNANVWFQTFNDDGVEHEYLMTEGYLWTGQYPECQRILEHGNNQSMELDENYLNADWTKNNKGEPEFFIINEAVISKLCILGEDVEPCFEGASITKMQYSVDNDFKNQLLSMMNELTNLLKGGTEKVYNTSENANEVTLSQTPAEVPQSEPAVSYEANIESQEVEAVVEEPVAEVESTSIEFSQQEEIVSEVIEETENVDFKKKDEDKEDKENTSESDDSSEEEKSEDESESAEDAKSDDDEEDKKKKKNEDFKKKCKNSLEEENSNNEYDELMNKYSALETSYNELVAERDNLKEQVSSLTAFKANIEKKEKEAMIDSFYMLTDDDKKDVIDNIDNYSIDEIEAKLSIICVRNKVSFATEENTITENSTVFNLNSLEEDDSIPAWVKAALNTEKNLK